MRLAHVPEQQGQPLELGLVGRQRVDGVRSAGSARCAPVRRTGRPLRARRRRRRRAGRASRRRCERVDRAAARARRGARRRGRSCRSCTVNSTSDSDPRPSFRWNCGSSPGGMRSRSMRAFMRRISRTSSSGNGSPVRRSRLDERRRTARRARRRRRRAAPCVSAWNSHVRPHCS